MRAFLLSMAPIFWVRFGFVLLCLTGLVLLVKKHREAARGLQTFMFEPTSAVNLGLLRVVVFFMLFQSSFSNASSWFVSLSPDFVTLPRGWEWLADVYPAAARWVHPEEQLFVVTSALATLGLFTRASSIITAVLAVWLLGIPNFYFKIGHDMHVPTLCALVVACSPAGDAVSLDSLIRRLRAPRRLEPHVAYTVPVRFSWLLLGTMYLFPGLWKLWESGDQWIYGDKLRLEMFNKWAQLPNYVPPFRVDHSQLALAFFGVMTLVFEVGFFFTLFSRRTRVFAALQATAFHLGIGLVMDIWFSLYFPLIVLLDLPRVLEVAPFRWIAPPILRGWHWLGATVIRLVPRLRNDATEVLVPRPPAASFVAGSLLLVAMTVAGLGPVDSWPISVYPRFSDRGGSAPRTSFSLVFIAKPPGGAEKELKTDFYPFGDTAAVFRIVRAALEAKKRNRQGTLDAHVALIARLVRENSPPMPKGTRLSIYRVDFSVDPADRARDDHRRSLIAETEL